MFVFYRLFHRCVNPTPLGSPQESSVSVSSLPSDPRKDRALIIWFAIFGISFFFRPAAELVIRILFFSACVLLVGTLDGSLNLLVGHAVLRAAKCKGYEPSLLSSMEAGSLGGLFVMGPTTLATVYLVALFGGLKLQRALSTHITLLLELLSVIAVSTAACSLGVTIILCIHPNDGPPPLDATRAARAGALGACILTVPVISTAAFLMREAQTMSCARNEPITPSPYLVDDFERSVNLVVSGARAPRHVVTHAAAEIVGYVLVAICILTIRLLCF